jgi:hypothetical protein
VAGSPAATFSRRCKCRTRTKGGGGLVDKINRRLKRSSSKAGANSHKPRFSNSPSSTRCAPGSTLRLKRPMNKLSKIPGLPIDKLGKILGLPVNKIIKLSGLLVKKISN